MHPASKPATRQTRLGKFQADLLASVVVFLVALPLCMGVAIASGVPVAAGLITGIVGGVLVGALAGCPLQVSGPAAGLTVIIFDVVERLGLEMLGLIVIVAGLLQLLAGAAKLGQWFRAVSPAVIKGMLAGIGFLILGGQFHVMLDGKPPGNGARNLESIPATVSNALNWSNLPAHSEWEPRRFALQESRWLISRQQRIVELLQEDPAGDSAGIASDQQALAEAVRLWVEQLSVIPAPELQESGRKAGKSAAHAAQVLSQAPADGPSACRSSLESLIQAQRFLKSPSLAGLLGLLTIVVIVVWQEFAPRAWTAIPPALVAVMVTTGVAAVWAFPVFYVDVPARLWEGIHWPSWELIQGAPWPLVVQNGLLVGVVASAETLLCAAAVDRMQSGPRTKFDQELMAHGVGNMVCGFLGALPMTGVIVRSSANVQAGARTRLSAMLHGVWLLVCVAELSNVLRMIPTSCLAAILVYTGYKLVDVKAIRELRDFGKGVVAIYAVTIAVIVFEDLLMGVIVGIVLSAVKIFYTFSHLRCVLQVDDKNRAATLALHGAATFIRLPSLASQLEKVPPGFELHVDFTDLDFIDHACLDLLMSWGTGQKAGGGDLILDWESLHGRFRRDRALTPTISS